MFIIAFFKLLARDFLELNFVMVAIEREALLLNLDSAIFAAHPANNISAKSAINALSQLIFCLIH